MPRLQLPDIDELPAFGGPRREPRRRQSARRWRATLDDGPDATAGFDDTTPSNDGADPDEHAPTPPAQSTSAGIAAATAPRTTTSARRPNWSMYLTANPDVLN
jgi:hypothetical protein